MTEWLLMGGYGFYVWSSFGVVFLCMLVEPLLISLKNKELVRRLNRINRQGENK